MCGLQFSRKIGVFVEKRNVFVKGIILMSPFVIINDRKIYLISFIASNIYKNEIMDIYFCNKTKGVSMQYGEKRLFYKLQ